MRWELMQYKWGRKLMGGSYYQVNVRNPQYMRYWTDQKQHASWSGVTVDEEHYIVGFRYNRIVSWQKEKTQRNTVLIKQEESGGADVHYQAILSQEPRETSTSKDSLTK